jgi:hypothetical protein
MQTSAKKIIVAQPDCDFNIDLKIQKTIAHLPHRITGQTRKAFHFDFLNAQKFIFHSGQ